VSLLAATAIFAAKFAGYQITGSTAIFSDAMESIVNIVAALFALGSLAIASRPADSSHPYGHGKVEFLSSGFEGGLIAFAALVILYQALDALWFARHLMAIGTGLVLVIAAGAANAFLGVFLVREGRRVHSPAIEADGLHVFTDFWTSAGVVVALVLVRLTGWQAIDPLVAMALGGYLAFVGARLVRAAVGGLLDESDRTLLERLTALIASARSPGVIAVHRLRAIRSGGIVHIDARVVVPRFWSVSQAHDFADDFERAVVHGVGRDAECIFHLDPCRFSHCRHCRLEPCPVRTHPFVEERDWPLEALTGEVSEE
jgi:cation diffusion facilitator family transporter